MSRRYRRLRLDVRTAYPGILGINTPVLLVQYQGQLVTYNGALVTAPSQGQQVNLNG